MKLYRTEKDVLVEHANSLLKIAPSSWDALISRDDLFSSIPDLIGSAHNLPNKSLADFRLLPPIGTQEVWAAGVTYFRSRNARMEEAKSAGGGDKSRSESPSRAEIGRAHV